MKMGTPFRFWDRGVRLFNIARYSPWQIWVSHFSPVLGEVGILYGGSPL